MPYRPVGAGFGQRCLAVKGLAYTINRDMCCKSQVVGMLSCFLNIVLLCQYKKKKKLTKCEINERLGVVILCICLELMQCSKDVVRLLD